ncbi:peptidase E, partial [Candidatus Pelagibacter communis]|uniref:Type 1 glutamine amidotransferase-like domain-containing protein n=1 Tax=Pelagibacter ubique TaxID=198252 RepID=UPI00094CA4D0
IEKYILQQSSVETPNVCFIPTASAEDKSYTVNFYTAFSKLNCNLKHISFFQRTPSLRSIINKQDIIYVGGGNTKSMLAVWREWKLDKLLLKAYQRGAILCGVSAGAICWFEKGITDSWASNLNVMDCMGFLKGSCCPHYDGEKERKPSVENFLLDNLIDSCYALDDG